MSEIERMRINCETANQSRSTVRPNIKCRPNRSKPCGQISSPPGGTTPPAPPPVMRVLTTIIVNNMIEIINQPSRVSFQVSLPRLYQTIEITKTAKSTLGFQVAVAENRTAKENIKRALGSM